MKTIIETTPKFNVTVKDIEDLPTELAQYGVIYQDLFGRREQKEHYQTYLEGLMLDAPNKSVETMMLNLKGDDPNRIRSMQHFVSEGSWQDNAILQRHWQEVSHDLGDENGILIGDDSGFPKQGGNYLWYFAEVENNTRVWLEQPQTAVPEWSGRGHKPTRQRLVAGEPETQLDGRIAVPHPTRPGLTVPETIANDRDWRLFQELAAQADLIISSGRYLRDWADGRAQEILRVDDPKFC